MTAPDMVINVENVTRVSNIVRVEKIDQSAIEASISGASAAVRGESGQRA